MSIERSLKFIGIENNERKSSRILHNLEHTRDTIVRENRETYRENIIPLMRYK